MPSEYKIFKEYIDRISSRSNDVVEALGTLTKKSKAIKVLKDEMEKAKTEPDKFVELSAKYSKKSNTAKDLCVEISSNIDKIVKYSNLVGTKVKDYIKRKITQLPKSKEKKEYIEKKIEKWDMNF